LDQVEKDGDKLAMQSLGANYDQEGESAVGDDAGKHEEDSSRIAPDKLQKSNSGSEDEAEDNSEELGNDGGDTNGSTMR
jgi:hypothetical protein